MWKIETQQVIATCAAHSRPIQCCMWSPFSQDLIITGSADFTLRIWSISNQTVLISPSLVKTCTRSKRTKKKKAKEAFVTNNDNEGELKADNSEPIITAGDKEEKLNPEPTCGEMENGNKNIPKFIKKKKTKKVTHFPGYSEILNDNKLWYQSVRKLVGSLKCNSPDNESGVVDCNGSEHTPNKDHNTMNLNDEQVPILLGSKMNLEDFLNRES